MDASIPGKYGFRRKSEQRSAAVARIWAQVGDLVDAEERPCSVAGGICWEALPKVYGLVENPWIVVVYLGLQGHQ
ncbi:hypothetical protein AK812_SmicGene460 [Symbiodinium microadriaticum]|uniref:Uncharacterized protein n=1 Tax=Symbiodinium microadriaticum TaxID=2951 RepID=A0A1Q9F6N3_SYMMI|nr:hypothetical protein AK812_SmicGene460 [Symbiodinium microadriaticum]